MVCVSSVIEKGIEAVRYSSNWIPQCYIHLKLGGGGDVLFIENYTLLMQGIVPALFFSQRYKEYKCSLDPTPIIYPSIFSIHSPIHPSAVDLEPFPKTRGERGQCHMDGTPGQTGHRTHPDTPNRANPPTCILENREP